MEVGQVKTLEECVGSKIQQPRTSAAATTPKLRHIGEVEIILVVLRISQRRSLGIDLLLMFANVCMMQDVQALSVGGHDAVFNTIMDHFDEVTSTIRPTVQVPLLSSSTNLFSSRCARDCIDARSQGREDRVEVLDDILLTANHQAVTALETPDASTRSSVNVVNALGFKLSSAPNIIVVVGITAIDDDVAWCEMWNDGFQCRIYRGSRHHQPDSTGCGEPTYHVFQR